MMTGIISRLRTEQMVAWPMTMLRISTGVMFVIAGYGKVIRGAGFGDAMVGFFSAQKNTFAFYQGFLESVVIPNKVLFGYLVAWGELLGGIALIVGLFTRWAALAFVFMVLNFWFAKGIGFWVPSNHDSFYILILLALYFSNAGVTLGLDGVLSRRRG